MKSRRNQNVVVATIGSWFLINVVASARAFQYCRSAHRDERNGFPYTAAVEWRAAATLFASNSFFADRCWREWERIMQLPRRLAQPIGTPAVTFAYKNALKSESLTREVSMRLQREERPSYTPQSFLSNIRNYSFQQLCSKPHLTLPVVGGP